MKKICAVFILGLLISACASKDENLNLPAENLYNIAYDNLEKTKYKKAAEQFEQLETEHPYSKWAVKAKLMAAYAYYKNESYDDAIIAADRFLKYHPGNKDADYAYYLKGMSYYDQISSADKDQLNTQKAEETFQRLVMLYPDSKYSKDVLQKINLAEDYKAAQEMIIGRYYLNNKNYLSALNRFNVVLEEYQKTVQIEEALYREVEIYAILGMNKYAKGYYKILNMNYPNGKWTQKAEKIINKIEKTKTENNNDVSSVGLWNKFGWSDENTNEVVEETKEETEVSDNEGRKWYKLWWPWFGNETENTEDIHNNAEPEDNDTHFASLWDKLGWSDEETNEVIEETKEKTEVSDNEERKWYKLWWPWFGNETENTEDALETQESES